MARLGAPPVRNRAGGARAREPAHALRLGRAPALLPAALSRPGCAPRVVRESSTRHRQPRRLAASPPSAGGRGLRSAAPPREGRQNKTDPGDTAKHDGTPWGGHSPHAQQPGGRGQGTRRTLPRHTAPAKGGWCEGCVKSSRSRPPLTCADRQRGPRNPQAAVFIYNNV